MTLPRPRPGLLDLAPYVGGDSSVPGVARVIKLASNEGAFGPGPRAVEALRAASARAHRYPDGYCTHLREALGRHFGLDPTRIVCGAGSDDLLVLLARAYAGTGDEVLYTEHGFLIYPIAARGVGAVPVAVPETNLTADVDRMLAHVTPRTRMLFIANPNNPTGTYLPMAELVRLREQLPPAVLLVIDAAYAEYIDRADYAAGFELVDAARNVVVTRTFSKIYGLGGVRLGWAYCPPQVADVLNRLRNPFNVSSLAQAAGPEALADQAFVARSQAHNAEWRTWTGKHLRALGLVVPESHCNFILVRFPADAGRDAVAADAFLRGRGIITRRMASYRLPDALRITVGLADEMQALVGALADFVEGRHG